MRFCMGIVKNIEKLKKDRSAVILAHNYQLPEVQDIADYVGDSLGLSIQAAKTEADVIVFCGVHFMAETAKILSPAKTVLLPDEKAGCPMADMITEENVRELKAEHPGAAVLCYVNTSAAVKAECDFCCTSANAVRMANEILNDGREIIFVPDRYLGAYVASQTGNELILWQGFCPTHARIGPENVAEAKTLHPEAEVLVHPECTPELTALADRVASTEGMCRYVQGIQIDVVHHRDGTRHHSPHGKGKSGKTILSGFPFCHLSEHEIHDHGQDPSRPSGPGLRNPGPRACRGPGAPQH